MADNQSQLDIIISAQDNASKQILEIQNALNKVGEELNATASQTSKATNSVGDMAKGFTVATLAANAITAGISQLRGEFADSIKAANQYQSSIAGLSSYALSFGVTVKDATDAAKSLASDGLLPAAETANGLKNLLSTGIGLSESIQLMEAFKDRAAFGKAATVDFGTAVNNLTEFFKTGRSQLGDLNGITTNYLMLVESGAAQMGVQVKNLDQAAKYQAAYLGILKDSIPTQGDAARFAETAAGAQAKLTNEINQSHIAIGTALQPAVAILQQSFTGLIGSFTGSTDTMKQVQASFASLAAVAAQAANVLVSAVRVIVGGFQSVATLSLDPIKNALKQSADSAIKISIDYQNQITRIANDSGNAQVDAAKKAYDGTVDAMSAASSQIAKQIARENESFSDAMKKRSEQFKQSMTDMIIAHRDKSQSLESDISKENAAYLDQVALRQQQLQEDLAGLEERHAEKVADITEQITEEKSKGLIVDGVLFAQANQKKIDKLQIQLNEENAKNQQAIDKRQEQYNKQVALDAKNHDEKVGKLKTDLNAELAVLKAHAAEVAAVGNKQKEDDISRLQRQYAEENAAALKQHTQRLSDMTSQGNIQGAALATAVADSFKRLQDAKAPEVNANSNTSGAAAASAMRKGFMDDLDKLPAQITTWIEKNTGAISGLKTVGKSAMAGLGALPFIGPLFQGISMMTPHSEGGIIDRPTLLTDLATGQPYGTMAENAPEAIVPMSGMGRQSSATAFTATAPKATNATYNFNNYAPISSDVDVRSVMREFGFSVGR